MARLRWRVYAESLWSPEAAQLARAHIPKHLHGQERIDFHRGREQAVELFKTLFPADDED